MKESLVGKVLVTIDTSSRGGWVCSGKFCLVLEENEDTLVAAELATEVEDRGSHCLEWPRSKPDAQNPERPSYKVAGTPFELRKGILTASEAHQGYVAYVKEGANAGSYSVWEGGANKIHFIGY